jgi:hypothetical protein
VADAIEPGTTANAYRVSVQRDLDQLELTSVQFVRPINNVDTSKTRLTMADADAAAVYRPGDIVQIDGQAGRAKVVNVAGAAIFLDQRLASAANGASLRLADVENAKGDDTIRFAEPAPPPDISFLGPGTIFEVDSGAGGTPYPAVVQSVIVERFRVAGAQVVTYRITFRKPLRDQVTANVLMAKTRDFAVEIKNGAVTYPFTHLSLDPANPYFFAVRINGNNPLLVFSTPPVPANTALPDNLPDATAADAPPTVAGVAATPKLTVGDYQNALDTLVAQKDVNMLAAPGTDPGVQGALRDQCEQLLNRFAIIDSQPGASLSDVEAYKATMESDKGYVAVYYPWIFVAPPPPPPGPQRPGPSQPVLVPPSGHVAGIYARTDSLRGVHKAPAGEEAAIRGSLGVERVLSDVEQGILNVGFGVNAIRVFKPQGRPIVWGARTTATGIDANWQYVNIRRLFLFLEGSISEGIRWAVFEPNNQELWKKLERTLVAFLTKVWRDGALFGATAKDAFYVRIDETLNPFTERQLGRLTIEIGVSPSYPAEFIVVRIGIWEGGSQVTEQ